MKKDKKNKKYNPELIYFNTQHTYSIPLVKEGLNRYVDNEERVDDVVITQDLKTGYIKTFKEGYQSKWFMDKYFEWLLYTGYIKENK